MPDLTRVRKPPRRFWLFAPYVVVLVAAVIWSLAWVLVSQTIAERMDAGAADLRARGWTVSWASRTISGFPFRLDVSLTSPRIAEPSGWAVAAPRLDGEAYLYAPGHWIAVAPQGLTLTRPRRGAVTLSGHALRASLVGVGQAQIPRISVEGIKLAFTPAPGSTPLPVVACDRLGLYLRPLDGDRAEVQLRLDKATPTLGGLLSRLDAARPIGLVWDQTLTRAQALHGPSWPAAVRAWSAAGGELTRSFGAVSASDWTLTIKSGQLTVDAGGYPEGDLALDLGHAGAAPAWLRPVVALAPLFKGRLTLKDGAVRLGPFRIAAAPRVF